MRPGDPQLRATYFVAHSKGQTLKCVPILLTNAGTGARTSKGPESLPIIDHL